ncbi:putative butyrate kinase [Desulfosarcina widdelii]|uniref:Probable butyrate kinase n=1 Tax=Desulfosarcina widdelii TaxID=947919 RepID=A0A5K7Z9I2_9BACT|nr:butyrate kinase [Desulfosarcina widdelii]BBO77708.1 putative butyrate kinase [Desulfosarcina widdelii]
MSKILVIDIGSTSTKLALFLDHDALLRESVEHAPERLSRLHSYDEWLKFHDEVVTSVLHGWLKELDGLSLVVSRGGLTRPVQGGAYYVNDAMLRDLRSGDYGWHPCNIGPCIASSIADRYGTKAIIYDSPVSDELIQLARFSGLKGMERGAAFHVLSQKSAGRKAARELGVPYEQGNFIVAHLGGGITIGAHEKGRIIDGTHGLDEGPFTPQRTGGLPLQGVLKLCFSGQLTQEELGRRLFGQGGVHSYLGTHDIAAIERRADNGDEEALVVLKAMGYQISKDICSMAAVLDGRIHAVVLTGNLCRARTVVTEIRNRVRFLGQFLIFPGEDELESLAHAGLRIMSPGGESVNIYVNK